MDTFKTWGSTLRPGIVAKPVLPNLGVRIINKSGDTNTVWFSSRAELVSYPRTSLLVVPEEERKVISGLISRWQEADRARVVSQPLQCQYRIGSANDGGTLSGIARLFYGDASKWPAIHEANRATIRNPNAILHGTIITIPKLKKGAKIGAASENQTSRSDANLEVRITSLEIDPSKNRTQIEFELLNHSDMQLRCSAFDLGGKTLRKLLYIHFSLGDRSCPL